MKMKCFTNLVMVLGLLQFWASCSSLPRFEAVRPTRPLFRVQWNKNLDLEDEMGNPAISFNAPLIYEGLLFIGSPKGKIIAYHLENGREIWSIQESRPILGQPGIVNDQVIYGTDEGRVYSRQYQTGKLNYMVDLGESALSRPTYYRNRLFFHLRNHKIICLDAATGKILWNYGRSVAVSPTVHGMSRPTPSGDKILVGFADGFLSAFSVEEGNLLWEQKLSSMPKFLDVDMTPLIYQDLLYTSSFSGPLTLLRPENGAIVLKIPITPSRAPLVSPEKDFLLIGTVQGTVHKMDKNHIIVLEKIVTDGGITSMAIWKGMLVLATTKGQILMLDPITLETVETFSLGGKYSTVFGSMEVEGKTLAVFSSRNHLYVFQ